MRTGAALCSVIAAAGENLPVGGAEGAPFRPITQAMHPETQITCRRRMRSWQPNNMEANMGFLTFKCVGCGYEHDAPLRYYRKMKDGQREYVCGESVGKRKDQGSWSLLPDAI